ncbi:hypothetical protein IAT38_005232 [Cryptococcus sp. DSM 104549]
MPSHNIKFIEATLDHGRTHPEFECTIAVDSHKPLQEAFQKVHEQFHPGDDTFHKYTFMIQSAKCPPIVVSGQLTPADFPQFNSAWTIVVIPQP